MPSRNLLSENSPENTYNSYTTGIQLTDNSKTNPQGVRLLLCFTHGTPLGGFHWFGRLIRWWTGVPFSHITVAADGRAIETTPWGTFVYDANRFAVEHPGLRAMIDVPAPRDPDIMRWAGVPPIRIWKIVLRVATFGWYDSRDCVCTAIAILIAAGVDVPTRIRTPRGLYRWLIAQGHRAHELPDDAA